MMMAQSNIPNKLEVQSDSGNEAELESQESRNRGGTEPNKRLNKLRSIKLPKVRSFKQSKRWVNSRSDRVSSILSGNQATPQKLSPIPMSDASPNYMKATSCSSARKENFQASPRNSESSFGSVDSNWGNSNHLKPNVALLGQKSVRALTRRSSFKPMKGLTRMSSLRSKRSLMKKNSGGAEMKRKLKKSRSIKLAGFESLRLPTGRAKNQYDRPSIISAGDAATPRNLSSTNSSDLRKVHCQASPRNSGSGFSSNGQNRKNWVILNPNSGSGQKTFMRKSSLRPVRILTKMSSLKPRRPTVRKHDRATCSSTLKNSNFPHHVELHSGGSESERISVMKVCPYKYCSLNGHCHAPLPPLKPFLLRRRRMLKTQKTMKRHFSGLEKEIQAYKMAFNIDTSRAGSPTAEKAGEDFFVEIYAKPSGKSKGEGAHGGDGEAKSDSGSLDEVLLGETSYPQIGMEESPSQLSHFQAANCSNKKGSDESVSEATDRDWKEEEIVASNLDNESHNSNVIDDQPDSVVFCSLEGEGPGLCNKPSSTLDDTESTSHEEVAVGGNVFQEVHEEFVSVLNSESNGGGSESNGEKADDLTIATGEPSSPSKSTQPYDHLESITINGVVHSASTCGPLDKLTEGGEEKHGVSKLDYGSLRGCSPAGDSELPCNSDEAIESQLEKQKFIRMWRLIYQHVVSGTAAKVRTQLSLDGAEGEKQQDEADSVVNGDACQDFSETNPDMEDNGADCQKIELCQIDAIRLVEEAIDGILLPETQDNLSDDHSVTSDTNSDQEISETNHGKDKERNIPASPSPAKDGFRELNEIHGRVADPEQTLLKHDNTTVQVREKTIFKVEDKPSQKMRKSWSNLKKVILLKKFIKAVEKVSKFNPQEPRYLPLQPKSEAEKIYLRHQEMEGRKSAEEWMLDYALQQVVSKLTPARRRKVALLVEAFEAISPLQDIESPLKPTAAVPFHGKPVQASISSSGQGGEETGKENDGGSHPLTLLGPEVRLKECAEQTSDSLTVAQNIPVISPDLQETNLDCFCPETELEKPVSVAADSDGKGEEIAASSLDNGVDNSTLTAEQPDFAGACLPEIKDSGLCDKFAFKTEDNGSTCCKEVQVDGEILQDVHQEIISSLKSEPCNCNFEANGKHLEIGNFTDESLGINKSPIQEDSEGWTTINKVVSSASVCDSVEEQRVVNEKINGSLDPDYGYLRGNPSPGDSEPESNTDVTYRNQMDKQRRNKMWYLIYQHVVSGIGANVESHGLLDDVNKTLPQGASETDQNKGMENHDAYCEDTELRQSDAIKLVQEAIDQMLSPQSEDHPLDNPSSTGVITAEQELLGENQVEGRELSISASNSSAEDGSREFDKIKANHDKKEDPEEAWVKADNITTPKEEKTVSKVGSKSNQPVSKNWSNLKKLILLKRFVKSLEKVKKFNPRGPRFLPLKPDPEAEKICLRHQTKEDRKNSEEWMLDYALQQVVTKLSPARRRRVELLVEAFETVTPPSQIEAQKRHNAASRATSWPLR